MGTNLEAKVGVVEVVLDRVIVLLVMIAALPMALSGSKILLESSRELAILLDGAGSVLVQPTAVLPQVTIFTIFEEFSDHHLPVSDIKRGISINCDLKQAELVVNGPSFTFIPEHTTKKIGHISCEAKLCVAL